jgi:two-component system nitrogen regulation sensor histidine kinase NtrY
MSRTLRWLPILLCLALWGVIYLLWPQSAGNDSNLIAWVNIALLFLLSLLLLRYGLRLLNESEERRPGSRLRAKLVMALVGMLLIPTGLVQITANQMVERGMNIWFDVRVDTLLDRALNLAQGFYARIDQDLQQGLASAMNDDLLLSRVSVMPLSYTALIGRMNEILDHEGWQSLQLYDVNERLIASVQAEGLAGLDSGSLSEQARMSMVLGRVTTELITRDGEELAVGYAPLKVHQNTVGLLKAEMRLPIGIVQNARAVETDYRTYKELERHRQSIRQAFTHVMLIVTLLIILTAGIVAIAFARRLTAPIGDLAHALQRVTEGDLNVSIPAAPDDELGSLVHFFNRMTLRLKQNMEALEKAQVDLTNALGSSRQRQYVLETLLANLQTGVLLLNADGSIRLINESLRQLLHLSGDWMVGRNIQALTGGRLHQVGHFFDELQHQQADHLQHELELTIEHRKLQILIRGARLSESGESGFSGYLLVLDDVSQLAEAQRHRAWAEVAQRLAHEIKNPLTPIKLAAERLQRRFRKQADDPVVFDTCTHAIIGQVERLQRLIADFSTLARMPKPKCSETRVEIFTHEIEELYNAYRRVDVQSPEDALTCFCDADQIRQILINLMDNALAATEAENRPVRLYVSNDENEVQIHVEDEGPGIPSEIRSHIFDAYYSTKEQGSGLGLSIAKRIADEHSGALELVSAAKPTHFCLRLPRQNPNMERP